MTLLAQQELLEPAPTRRLIVPEGCTSWWGVDPSTLRVAVAGVSRAAGGELDRWVRSVPFSGSDGAPRLSEIYAVTRYHVEGLATCCPWPGLVLVEQPSGQQENPQLSYAVGVTIAAVHDGLREVTGHSLKIETITSSSWKKRACGRGDIRKTMRVPGKKRPVRVPHDEYGVLRWARANGYDGSSWDDADAWGIAEAARRDVALEPRR